MRYFDAAVIGGGVLGCFAARNLRRWNISTVLIEAAEDVCTGITRANTAIVYAGYDNKVGSLKAQMTVRGNGDFASLCEELEVPFSRCGSLMASFGPQADKVLLKKYDQGQRNGVPGLRLLSGEEAAEKEPMLAGGVTSALYAPSTGTVNPWQLGIAAYENAVRNGCTPLLNTQVLGIRKTSGGYVIETGSEPIECKVILNCAGLNADKVQELLFPPSVRLFCDGADFFVLDKHAASPSHIIFHESEEKGKGITAVPTVEGNLLLGPSQRPLDGKPWATSHTGMNFLRETACQVLPGVDLTQVIRSFASVRPNPHRVVWKNGAYVPDGKSIGSFVIENPAPGFYSLIGIKTPGLTCANELGMYLARESAVYLNAAENTAFDPYRRAIWQKDHEIICQCEHISKAQILEAIARGSTTVDGVKRRVGSGMGKCQGSRCTFEIETLLEECHHGTL
ncbi:MAG: FAD-dependent oxidoreductase [Oscillospiraceae bacterium]|nr:FAD-dependent oxidoreductase [Oscillospiraceae bacterium]